MKPHLMFYKKVSKPKHILISRVDAMGDVVLALPLCGLVKKYYPDCRVTFLGRTYTKSIADCCVHIDDFIDRDEWNGMSQDEISISLQKKNIDTVMHLLPAVEVLYSCAKAKIPVRIGGMNKLTYWKYCNRIVRYSRKRSNLNEAQLNIKLLPAIGINEFPERNELPQYYGFEKIPALLPKFKPQLDDTKFNLVIHPLSNKNAKEWGLHNFSRLISMLDLSRFKIFITGSEKEREILKDWIIEHTQNVTDLTGRLTSDQLIAFIAAADGLIASSTGPVHLAAASGIRTLGLYENRWTKRGERWGPIGVKAEYLECVDEDMDTISPEMVKARLDSWADN